jgi:hypothetical protein
MSVVSPCHLQDEILRVAYVVSSETSLVGAGPTFAPIGGYEKLDETQSIASAVNPSFWPISIPLESVRTWI